MGWIKTQSDDWELVTSESLVSFHCGLPMPAPTQLTHQLSKLNLSLLEPAQMLPPLWSHLTAPDRISDFLPRTLKTFYLYLYLAYLIREESIATKSLASASECLVLTLHGHSVTEAPRRLQSTSTCWICKRLEPMMMPKGISGNLQCQ